MVSQCDVLNKFTLESLHLLKNHRLETLLAKNRGLLLKDFGEFINKTQTRLPELQYFSSFLSFLQGSVDLHVTFESQLYNLKISHSFKTFIFIGFSQRRLIYVVRGSWAYSSLSLADLVSNMNELVQTALVYLEMRSHKEDNSFEHLLPLDVVMFLTAPK